MFTFCSDIFAALPGAGAAGSEMTLCVTRAGPGRTGWPGLGRAGPVLEVPGGMAAYGAAGVARAGGGCYGGPAARLARVWRRRLRVVGGSPAAARRAFC